MTDSTIMTAPSMINPKSSAPRLIRLPLTPKRFIIQIAKSMARGMTEATSNPARTFPKKRTSTNTTMSAPSKRFVCTVLIALLTILVRSRKGSMMTPFGRVFLISSTLALTSVITWLLLAPLSIMTTAPATSPLSL
ncbi:hypothetical protein D3C73_633720 [compost metagenome]